MPAASSACWFNQGMQYEAPAAASPTALTVHQASRVLEVAFHDGSVFRIPFELMRVYSPSAEVQGHGPGQEVLQTGKRGVGITAIEPVGHYGVQPRFSDGHDTGIFTWAYLYRLGRDEAALWRQYEDRLAAAGRARDDPMPGAGGAACGHH
jgi:DUF971 family protein